MLRWAERRSASSEAGGDRRTLRALSLAPAGSGTRHGAVARAVWAVIAGGGVPAPGPLRTDRRFQTSGCGAPSGPALRIWRPGCWRPTSARRRPPSTGSTAPGGRTRELEEAWIIHALVREDGMSQVEVAELLGRHKSWVCRRLALIERLGSKARDELRVGLLSPTAARQIVRLPEGNQGEVLDAVRREALAGAELTGVVDLWLRLRRTPPATVHPGASARSALAGERLAARGARSAAERSRQSGLEAHRTAAGCAGAHGSVAGAPWPQRG